MIQAARYPLPTSSGTSIPDCSTASLAAQPANCEYLSAIRNCLLRPHCPASKLGTSPAMVISKSSVGKPRISWIPHSPFLSAAHNLSTPTPKAVTAPWPVTTTRRRRRDFVICASTLSLLFGRVDILGRGISSQQRDKSPEQLLGAWRAAAYMQVHMNDMRDASLNCITSSKDTPIKSAITDRDDPFRIRRCGVCPEQGLAHVLCYWPCHQEHICVAW